MEENKTYLLVKSNGEEMQITVPTSWKVTFGPAVIGTAKATQPYNSRMPMAIRFYEKQDQQRAIFTDVVSFRDMSIPIMIKKTHIQEKQGFMECDGRRKATSFQAKIQEWVNPDENLEQKALPVVENFDVEFVEEGK